MVGNIGALESIFGMLLMILYFFASVYIPLLNVPLTQLKLVHQTGIAVILGFLSGLILNKVTSTQTTGNYVSFDESLFFYYLLPPIIFAEGFNMKRQRFFQNAGYVSLFGILGTIICFLVNAICAFYLSSWGVIKDIDHNSVQFTLKDVVLFGSVLSASDTVAAISVISEEEAPVLRGILLGEGVVNDAVAIILFQSAMRLDMATFDVSMLGLYVLDIAYICLTSVLIGLLFGLLSAAMTRKFREFNKHPPYEVALLFFLAYVGYMVSVILDISGVISILTTAIMMGHYTWYNLSHEAREVSRTVFHIVGHVIEAFIFVYMGLTSYEYYTHFAGYLFMLEYSLVVMFARFAGIVIFPGLLKLVVRGFKLKWMELITLWFAGSIRGAIAFALILTVSGSANK